MKISCTIHNLSLVTLLSLAFIPAVNANHIVSGPGVVCYDFTDSATGPFFTNDTIVTPDATIEINKLRSVDGAVIVLPGIQDVEITTTDHSGSISPEMNGYFTNTQIIPNNPVTAISIHVGINTSIWDGIYGNIGVNGERIQLANGLPSADGLVLGNDADGQVKIETELEYIHRDDNSFAHWIEGELTLTALTGRIHKFSIGSRVYTLDDVCLIQ